MINKLNEMKKVCDYQIAQLESQILFQQAKKQVIDEMIASYVEEEKCKCACESAELVEEPVENVVEQQNQNESY